MFAGKMAKERVDLRAVYTGLRGLLELPFRRGALRQIRSPEFQTDIKALRLVCATLLKRVSRGWEGPLVACGGLTLVELADLLTPPSVSLVGLYVCSVAAATFVARRSLAYALCGFAALACYGPELLTGRAEFGLRCLNAAFGAGALLLIVWAVAKLRARLDNFQSTLEQCNAELAAEISDRKALERETIEASRREQTRIAHQLHDALGSDLAGVALRVAIVIQDLKAHDLPGASDCRQVLEDVNTGLARVRSFARVLDPVAVVGAKIGEALTRLGAEIGQAFGVNCVVDVSTPLPAVSDSSAQHLYFIMLEAARNAVQHADAELISVRLQQVGPYLELLIQNDGLPWQTSERPEAGMGLRIMRSRIASVGGVLRVEAAAGGGTVVRCRAPIGADVATTPHLANSVPAERAGIRREPLSDEPQLRANACV